MQEINLISTKKNPNNRYSWFFTLLMQNHPLNETEEIYLWTTIKE